MSSEDVNTLIEMGFEKEKAERALTVTGNQGVEPAMEWLLAHAGEMEENNVPSEESPQPEPSQPQPSTLVLTPKPEPELEQEAKENESTSSEVNSDESAEAKSLKCDTCGRLFKSQLEVEFHAAKSGHSSFSESTEEKKPLTEEEKKEQLKKIEEKLKQKRKEREEKEKVEALEREKHRIKSGKEISAAKKKLEEEEMKKLVDQRKREKEEERLARERVKAQIEADRAARRAKQSGVEPSPPLVQTPLVSQSNAAPSRDYAQTKIQIRLTNGQALTQTFGVKEQLSAVRLYVEMNRTDGSGPFALMTNFPKKIFNDEDYEKPLDILGLVPSAVLIVSRGMMQ